MDMATFKKLAEFWPGEIIGNLANATDDVRARLAEMFDLHAIIRPDGHPDGYHTDFPDTYRYIDFLSDPDNDQAPREDTLWPHQWEACLASCSVLDQAELRGMIPARWISNTSEALLPSSV